MDETRKSMQRRSRDPLFHRYFRGVGIDIGAGRDSLGRYAAAFPGIERVVAWDLPDGDAQYMAGLAADSFDFVHSSHCLEHMRNPWQALGNWLRILKPGGALVVTVPDEDLYEKGHWPSRHNADHRCSFTICKPPGARMPASVDLVAMIALFAPVASCERLQLVRDFHDEGLPADVDQTAIGPAECAIELVLRKRDVPPLQRLLADGEAVRRRGDDAAALALFGQAVALYPFQFEAYWSLAVTLQVLGHIVEAESVWDLAAARLPHEHMPRLYQALHKIGMGKLNEGFALRDVLVADARRTAVPPPDWPRWRGESLQGRSIAIWTEFGLGDEIFFLRFADVLKQRCGAAAVTVVCQRPLLELFRTHAGIAVCADDAVATLPRHDFWVFPHSIPVHLPLSLDDVPAACPYLAAPPARPELAAWLAEAMPLEGSGRLRVGLSFRGAPNHENDAARSLPSLALLDEVLALDGAEFHALQRDHGRAECETYAARRPNFHDCGPYLTSMADTAAIVERLDLVISVDTSIAHLAAAMGRPTWILLPSYGDWRWHFGRSDSPWYPTVRLFRQPRIDAWAPVLREVRDALADAVAELQPATAPA